ncbi:MAG: DNA polymerase III subunit [Planctomycetes bacterium]|nr:DNA polymerase III subunit [Planctomycetota bacterium]
MSFADLLGQDAAVSFLRNALRRGRLAHAYIFSGPEGVGKRRLARELARALSCERRREDGAEACGECRSCGRFDRAGHEGYREVGVPEDRREIPVDAIRQGVLEPLGVRAFQGAWRVFVVDPADAMNAEAANCLLKTLEEPSPRVVLVLVTARIDHLLPTLLSRSQVVRFRPLPLELGRRILGEATRAEPAELDEALRAAGGSPGLALRVLERRAIDAWKKWGERVLGLRPVEAVEVAAEVADWIKKAGSTLEERRERARPFLELLALRLRERFLAGVGPGTDSSDGAGDLDLAERVLDAQLSLNRNLKVDFVLEDLFLAIADERSRG